MATYTEILQTLDTLIETRAVGGGVRSISVGGRTIQYETLTDLFKLRQEFSQSASAETVGGIRFNRAARVAE